MSINVTITSETISECQDFLHIIYDDKEYLLEEFAKEYKTNDFSLDKKLKESTIVYRGKRMTYDEFWKANHDFGEELKFVDRYNKEIYPLEYLLIMRNSDYYKAAKYIKKTEQCFQTARYYLLNSYDLLKTDFEVNWSSGYVFQFLFRTMDFTTAVVWYNSCFDYILQVAYFAFGIYKKTNKYTDQTSHEDLLHKCTYKTMKEIYNQYKAVPNYKALWKIISKCHNALSEINSWANYIKHKGGISFKGLNPPEPFHMSMTDTKGNIVAESSNFESIEIDLDDSLLVLKDVHKAIYDCINSLIDFIDFNSAQSPKVILP